jgi:hypothetical protein
MKKSWSYCTIFIFLALYPGLGFGISVIVICPSTLLGVVSPSTLLRTVSLSNGLSNHLKFEFCDLGFNQI